MHPSTWTTAEWNLVLNAAMTALMVGYGLWIHHIVKQQEKLKDIQIQTLQTTIAGKDSEIARLKSDTAPNIAAAYEKMRDHAEKMTGEVMKLQEAANKRQMGD